MAERLFRQVLLQNQFFLVWVQLRYFLLQLLQIFSVVWNSVRGGIVIAGCLPCIEDGYDHYIIVNYAPVP